MGFLESPLRSFSVSFFRRPTYLTTILAFLLQSCNQGTPLGRSRKGKTSPEMLIYRSFKRRYKFFKKVAAFQLHFDSNWKWNIVKLTQTFYIGK